MVVYMLTNCAQELRDALRSGTTLDELWKVARGEIKYADFLQGNRGEGSTKQKQAPRVPEELVSMGNLIFMNSRCQMLLSSVCLCK